MSVQTGKAEERSLIRLTFDERLRWRRLARMSSLQPLCQRVRQAQVETLVSEKHYPEPIWSLYLTAEQIAQGDWLRIEPEEIVDYKVNPFAAGWEARYIPEAISKIKVLGLSHSAESNGLERP